MTAVPEFAEAVARFRRHLEDHGERGQITWAFRDDIWPVGEKLRVFRSVDSNAPLVEEVYARGRERGLVEIVARGRTETGVVATVWFPKTPGDGVQGWSEGLKLSIVQPLRAATVLPSSVRLVARVLPSYRRYQHQAVDVEARERTAA